MAERGHDAAFDYVRDDLNLHGGGSYNRESSDRGLGSASLVFAEGERVVEDLRESGHGGGGGGGGSHAPRSGSGGEYDRSVSGTISSAGQLHRGARTNPLTRSRAGLLPVHFAYYPSKTSPPVSCARSPANLLQDMDVQELRSLPSTHKPIALSVLSLAEPIKRARPAPAWSRTAGLSATPNFPSLFPRNGTFTRARVGSISVSGTPGSAATGPGLGRVGSWTDSGIRLFFLPLSGVVRSTEASLAADPGREPGAGDAFVSSPCWRFAHARYASMSF